MIAVIVGMYFRYILQPSDCAVQNTIAITVIHAIWAIMDSSPPARVGTVD